MKRKATLSKFKLQKLNSSFTKYIVGCGMNRNRHSIHVAVAQAIRKTKPRQLTLLEDEACGGNQRIPLFKASSKSRKNEFCNVDLLILKNNKVKVIVEIEESNVKPTQIGGKFMTSALSNSYIHEPSNEPVEMDDSVIFVQVVDTANLNKGKTSKLEQWKALEDSISAVLPLKNSSIKSYRLIPFENAELFEFQVKQILESL